MAVELASERRLWWVFSPVGATRLARPGPGRPPMSSSTSFWVGIAVWCFVLLPVVGVFVVLMQSYTFAQIATWALVVVGSLLALLVGALTAHAIGSKWWVYGAGHPVLQVDGGRVRGRLHGARRRGPAYAGWDFDVPLDEVTDAHLTDAGNLVMRLPQDLVAELADRPSTSAHTRSWRRYTGYAIAWPASQMMRSADRAARLERLVAALNGDQGSDGVMSRAERG